MNRSRRLTITGGQVLLPTGVQSDVVLSIEDGFIVAIGSELGRVDSDAQTLNARGLWVLPSIVDLHGDAFERQIMPRPGVHFDLQMALAETDRQLVSNGIATAFHGVTFSWEPGLRSRDTLVSLMAALSEAASHLACDTRLHLRHETFNLEGEQDVLQWLAEGRIDLLAFNDHTHDILRKLQHAEDAMALLQRTGLSAAELQALATRVAARSEEVPASVERLAAAARAVGVPMASHDDPSPSVRDDFQKLGCHLCEFPKTQDTAAMARGYGNAVVLGAPNVVRGGSQSKAVSASAMVQAALCTVLSSDYYYPAMLPAAFRLSADGMCDLASAWAMVSSNPAEAVGLSDRGRLAVGLRGDVLLVSAPAGRPPRVASHFIGGERVFTGKGAPI
jgi:alpha-D-ribose 1-methylphosphonate 5-triphosphate diphosphatase